MHKVVGVLLLSKVSLLRFLHVVGPALALGKANGRVLVVELHDGSLHVVSTSLVAHQVVFPAVGAAQNVPVQLPEIRVVVPRLRGGLGLLVDSHHPGPDHFLWSAGNNLVLLDGDVVYRNGLLAERRDAAELTNRGSGQVSRQHLWNILLAAVGVGSVFTMLLLWLASAGSANTKGTGALSGVLTTVFGHPDEGRMGKNGEISTMKRIGRPETECYFFLFFFFLSSFSSWNRHSPTLTFCARYSTPFPALLLHVSLNSAVLLHEQAPTYPVAQRHPSDVCRRVSTAIGVVHRLALPSKPTEIARAPEQGRCGPFPSLCLPSSRTMPGPVQLARSAAAADSSAASARGKAPRRSSGQGHGRNELSTPNTEEAAPTAPVAAFQADQRAQSEFTAQKTPVVGVGVGFQKPRLVQPP